MDIVTPVGSVFLDFIYVLVGLCIGSFLNVCIYRIPASREEFYGDSIYGQDKDAPRMELSLAKPTHSICPHCKHRLLWRHNIPAFSWIFLRGRCAYCEKKIPFRYPFVELLAAVFCLYTFNMFGLTATSFVLYAFVCSLIVIAFIDYDYYIIPNVISLPGTGIALGIAALNHFTHIFSSPIVPGITTALWGVLIGAGFLWLIAEFYLRVRKVEGLGMGDVKLLAMTGALLGPSGAFYTIFVGSLLGSVCGLALILFTGRKASQHIPFGPYLVIATLLYVFTGNMLIEWWVSLVVGGNPDGL